MINPNEAKDALSALGDYPEVPGPGPRQVVEQYIDQTTREEGKRLPYAFDLLYDFKTREQLYDHISGKRRSATSATDNDLFQLMQEYNIPFPDKLEVIEKAEKAASFAEQTEVMEEVILYLAERATKGDVKANSILLKLVSMA